jgi:DDE superfamily endonuclease
MDNLGAHKVEGVRQAIEAAGAELLYLPPYSPDLNPIELAFAKLKSLLKARRPAPSTCSGAPSASSSMPSAPPNAPITSTMPAMFHLIGKGSSLLGRPLKEISTAHHRRRSGTMPGRRRRGQLG